MTRTIPAEFKAVFLPAKDSALNAFISSITSQPGAAVTKKKTIQQALPRNCRLIAIKDNIVTIQSRTTCASKILQRHESPFEASVIKKINTAGGTIVGKTNLDEFGMGSHNTNSFFGHVQNQASSLPHSPGGSSGGSAVAVASQQCEVALGTDTGGSVRLPAAYTGVVGFKPSYGTISRWGVIPYANSLDTVGILGATTHLVEVTTGFFRKHDSMDPTSITRNSRVRIKDSNTLGPRNDLLRRTAELNVKVGVPIEYNIEELDPIVRRAWHHTLNVLEESGCTIVPVSLPNTKHALSAYYAIAAAEAASNLSKYDGVRYGSRSDSRDGAGDVLYSKTRGEFFGEEVKRRILLGSYTLSSEAIDNYFIQAQKVRRLVQRDFDRVFSLSNPLRPSQQFDLSDMDESIELDSKLGPAQVDFIVCPTAPTLAPTLEIVSKQDTVDAYMNDVFTVPASLAGIPALTVPYEIPEEFQQCDHPPFAGMQVLGQFGDDTNVLKFGGVIESLLLDSISPFPPETPAGEEDTVNKPSSQSKESFSDMNPLKHGSQLFKRKVLHLKLSKMASFAERTQVKTVVPEEGRSRISTSIDHALKVATRRWRLRLKRAKNPWLSRLHRVVKPEDFAIFSGGRGKRLIRLHYVDSAISNAGELNHELHARAKPKSSVIIKHLPNVIITKPARRLPRYKRSRPQLVVKKYLIPSTENPYSKDSLLQTSTDLKMAVRRRFRRTGQAQMVVRAYPSLSEVDRRVLTSLGHLNLGEDWPSQIQQTGEQFRDTDLLFRARRRLYLTIGESIFKRRRDNHRLRWFERPPPLMSQINKNIKRGSQKRLELDSSIIKFSVAEKEMRIRAHASRKGKLRAREPKTEREVEAAFEKSFASWDNLMASSPESPTRGTEDPALKR